MQQLRILLKSIGYDNFCGSGKEEYPFFETITNVSGMNGLGKTRIENAFNYLMFDKNADDRKDFNIKNTVDLSKNRQETEVWGIINANGNDIQLKKIYREIWRKKQGSQETEFSGNETIYYYNEVPCNKKEYQAKIDGLIQEELFKLLTKVSYFNKLNWKAQREIIFKLVPEVTDLEVATGNKEFEHLLSALVNNKTMEEYKREISAKKTKIKDDLKGIPERIDELGKTKPAIEDWNALKADVKALENKIAGVDERINAELSGVNSKALEQQAQQEKVNALKLDIQNLEHSIRTEYNSENNGLTTKKQNCRANIDRTETDITSSKNRISSLENTIKVKSEELQKLRDEWDEVNASKFKLDPNATKCSQCDQEVSAEDVEAKITELKSAFEKKKSDRLATLNTNGPVMSFALTSYQIDLSQAKGDLENSETTLAGFKQEFLNLNTKEIPAFNEEVYNTYPEYVIAKAHLAEEEAKLVKQEPVDQTELKLEKSGYQKEIDALKIRINNETIIENTDNRTIELKTQESKLSQELAGFEKIEFSINKFDKARVDKIEGQVNAKFKLVKFRLFETQVNGGEVPTCTALVNGVPFADANRAGQLIAGLDIISTLSAHYNVFAPIFVDNAEAINEIPAVNTQIITLSVSNSPVLKIAQ